MPWFASSLQKGTFASPFTVETTAVFFPLLPNFLTTPLVSIKEVEKPIYEVQELEKEAPYVSFDENGEELIKYRKVIKEEKVRVGVEKIEEEVIDSTLTNDIFGFCYNHTKKVLTKWLPEDKIETVK